MAKTAVGCTGPTVYPVVFTGYQQDDRSQSWCKKRLDRIGHTHRDGEPFRVFVDPGNLKSVVHKESSANSSNTETLTRIPMTPE